MLLQYKQCYERNKKYFLLSGIVIIGALLRFPGINEGIVHTFQPDERHLVNPAIEMAMYHTLWHDYFTYPGQFISKIAAVFIWIYSKMKQIPIEYNVVEYYFIFRGITAFFSTMTIVAAYFVGEKMERGIGLLLAGFTALFPQFILMARQVTGDTTALFFTVLLLWCSLQYLEKKQYRYLVWMAVLAGMATLEKWHSAVACFYIGIVILFTCKGIKNFIRESIMAFLVYISTMFIIAPNMVIHPNEALEGILYMKNYGGEKESWIRYMSNLKAFYGTANELGGWY